MQVFHFLAVLPSKSYGYPQGKQGKKANETQNHQAKREEIQNWGVHPKEIAAIFGEFHGKDH